MKTEKDLTKHSQNSLRIIQNFLLYISREAEFSEAAFNYVLEDHVDGEDSPQAWLERALSSELIGEDIFLHDDVHEQHPCNLYVDKNNLLYCVDLKTNEVTLFELTKPQEVLEVEYRDEILSYCLGSYIKADEVSIKDIFIHGKFVKKLG